MKMISIHQFRDMKSFGNLVLINYYLQNEIVLKKEAAFQI
jgi:hypothetical protein